MAWLDVQRYRNESRGRLESNMVKYLDISGTHFISSRIAMAPGPSADGGSENNPGGHS
jgi:hypothetical protein